MTSHQKKLFGSNARSLSRQISQAANRLDQRKHSVSALASTLGSRMLSTLASPGSLWLAGGAGFLLAEWINRPGSSSRPAGKPRTKSTRPGHTAALSNLALLVKFGLDLSDRSSRRAKP